MPKIAGITRVRNEGHIMKAFLDYYASICTAGMFVYDDFSTDNTKEIAETHPGVAEVFTEFSKWDEDPAARGRLEGWHRRIAHGKARKHNPDWILCVDADEFIEFDFENFIYEAFDVVRFKLFDFYITPKDHLLSWHFRQWMGPEFRMIPMLVREHPDVYFHDRPMKMMPNPRIHNGGYVRHYGKAISVEQWEAKCEYYAKYRNEPYKTKWDRRRGRAIHNGFSDFGNELIKWEDKDRLGRKLGPELAKNEFIFWSDDK